MQLLGREVGLDQPLFLIAGPCVVESEELQMRTAERLKSITDRLGIMLIFKSSFDKARHAAQAAGINEDTIMVCERGVSFGYNNLVSDMRSLAIMRETGCPVVFDATHSVQLPGGQGTSSGGQREFVPVLARAAVATGVAGLFMETHPDPANAKSDGPNAWPLDRMESLLTTLVELDRLVKRRGFEEAALGR